MGENTSLFMGKQVSQHQYWRTHTNPRMKNLRRFRSWKIRVACAVCFLKPEGCTHCVLLCAPGRLLTITGKRSSLSGLNPRGWGGSWKIRVACGWGWGVLENTEGDMRCAFWNLYPNLHLICYPRRGMIKDRPFFQLVPKFTPLQPQM